jgi:nitroreductase
MNAGLAGATRGQPRSGDVAYRYAIRAAALAPSVLNTQPWYFAVSGGTLLLYADPGRRLDAEDPAGREMVISCGAALANLSLAIRHLGFSSDLRPLPDVGQPSLLAEVRWGRHAPPSGYENLLHASVARRHTRRGPFVTGVPPLVAEDLVRVARQERADLRLVYDAGACRALAGLVRDAEFAQRASPRVAAERARWARTAGNGRLDGVAPTAQGALWDGPEFACRDFGGDPSQESEGTWYPDEPRAVGLVALLTTRDDRRPGWLIAGQALQRLLLHATARGVGAAFHTQPLEIPRIREAVRAEFTDRAYPQLLLRFGCGAAAAATPRRPVSDVLRVKSRLVQDN